MLYPGSVVPLAMFWYIFYYIVLDHEPFIMMSVNWRLKRHGQKYLKIMDIFKTDMNFINLFPRIYIIYIHFHIDIIYKYINTYVQ